MGAGPAGFYTADALLKGDPQAEVDLIDRLPTPWGLVRLGVADHENIKAVSRAFREDRCAAGLPFLRERRGRPTRVTRAELMRLPRRRLHHRRPDRPAARIPGEDLTGRPPPRSSSPGTTAIPTTWTHVFDLAPSEWSSSANGNVAVDVARMLCSRRRSLHHRHDGRGDRRDAPEPAIAEIVLLRAARPRAGRVHHAGAEGARRAGRRRRDRRPRRTRARPASERRSSRPRARGGTLELLEEYAARRRRAGRAAIVLRFLVSPVEILGDDRVEASTSMQRATRTAGA